MAIGGTPPTSIAEYFDGEIPWVSIADMTDSRISDPARSLTPAGLAASGARILAPGTLLYSFKLSIGRTAFVERPLATNEAIAAILPSSRINLRFARWALPIAFEAAASTNIYGAKILNQEQLRAARIPCPQVSIQERIADYLDHETAEIDAFIADLDRARAGFRERLIAVREERFGGWVNRGDLAGLRAVVLEVDKRIGPQADEADLLSVSISDGVFRRADRTDDAFSAADLTNYKMVRSGDLVLNRMRAFQGALGIAPIAGITSPDYAVLRPDQKLVDPDFLAEVMRSPRFVFEMSRRLRGIGGEATGQVRTPRVAVWDLLRIRVQLPDREEQTRLARNWKHSVEEHAGVTADIGSALALAKERRAALITAAVTGQIDVTAKRRSTVEDIQQAIEEER